MPSSSLISAVVASVLVALGAGRPDSIPESGVTIEELGSVQIPVESDGSFGELVGTIGLKFLGTPYVGGTLEGETEVCRVDLTKLDCVTFFETALAAARILDGRSDLDIATIREYVTETRYRGGTIDGYTSRLHYFVEWVSDNQRRGIVEDITRTLPGSVQDTRRIDFMSSHRSAYKPLAADDEAYARIVEIEAQINGRERWMLPKDRVAKASEVLRTGDIVGITTSIGGLDVSHTGLVYVDDTGAVRLLHASLTKKKVILDGSLSEYLAGNRKQTGIIVARPVGSAHSPE